MTDVTTGRVTELSFVLLTASGYVAGTIGTRAVPPITLLTWRFTIAAVALAGIAVGTLYQRRHGHGTHLASGGAIQLAAAAVAFAPIAALHGGLRLPSTVPALGALTWLVLANSIGAATLFLLLVRRRSAA